MDTAIKGAPMFFKACSLLSALEVYHQAVFPEVSEAARGSAPL